MKLLQRLLVMLFAISFALPAQAQPAGEGAPPPAAARKRFKKLRDRVLKQKVGLSEAKAKRVVTIVDKYEAQRHKVQEDMRAGRQALRQLLKHDSDDQAAYRAALDKLQQASKKLDQLRSKQFTELRAVLAPKEQAKLLRAMHKAKRLLNERRNRRGQAKRGKGHKNKGALGKGKRGKRPRGEGPPRGGKRGPRPRR